MSKFQTIYGKVRSELVILGGSILAAIGLAAALTTGTVHTVAQDALPVAALVIAVVTRNKVFSAATVADLIATAKSIAALKAAKPDPQAMVQVTGASVSLYPSAISASAPPPVFGPPVPVGTPPAPPAPSAVPPPTSVPSPEPPVVASPVVPPPAS